MLPQHLSWRTVIVSAPEQIHDALSQLSHDGYTLHSVVAGVRLWGDNSSRTVPCWVLLGYTAKEHIPETGSPIRFAITRK